MGWPSESWMTPVLSFLLSAIKDQSLPCDDRLNILSDHLALVQAGQISTKSLLQLMESYREDKNVTVWESLENCLKTLREMAWDCDETSKALNEWTIWLLGPANAKLGGWQKGQGDDHLRELFRALVVRQRCHLISSFFPSDWWKLILSSAFLESFRNIFPLLIKWCKVWVSKYRQCYVSLILCLQPEYSVQPTSVLII